MTTGNEHTRDAFNNSRRDASDDTAARSGLRTVSPGLYEGKKAGRHSLFTKSASPGYSVYGEKVYSDGLSEYRAWDPKRSKLGAFYAKKAKLPIGPDSKVLYLGAASGTTVSHVSDILAEGTGVVYAVEFADRPMRDLIMLSKVRPNIIPIMADANRPILYSSIVEPVDVLFQDVAQANQAEIAGRNASFFLKPGGCLILSIKARSIDVAENPKKIFKEEIRKLEKGIGNSRFRIIRTVDPAPFHDDHMGVIAERLPDQ